MACSGHKKAKKELSLTDAAKFSPMAVPFLLSRKKLCGKLVKRKHRNEEKAKWDEFSYRRRKAFDC